MTRWMALALTLLALARCDTATSPEDVAVAPAPVLDGTFELQRFELSTSEIVPVPDPARYTLTFVEGSRLSARADCNLCNADYELTGSAFDVGLLACTRAACPPGSLEGAYVQALEAAFSLELVGAELSVVYPDGTLRFRAGSP